MRGSAPVEAALPAEEEVFLHVFAPALTAYAEWVLRDARDSGIRRLYFLARDGWMMLRAARVLARKMGLDIELCYLCVSRQALRAAESSEEAFRDAEGYFRQEGLLDAVPYAFVDSGWAGTTQQSLQCLLGRMGRDAGGIRGYYFGIYEVPRGTRREGYRCFYLSPERGLYRKRRFAVCLFEAVCSAPEGMTLRYEEQGGAWAAIRKEGGNPNAERIRRYGRALEAFLSRYEPEDIGAGTGDGAGEAPGEAVQGMLDALLLPCMGDPTRTEAEALGSLKFSWDVREQELQSLAASWDRAELRRQRFLRRAGMRALYRAGILRRPPRESGWQEASIVLAAGEGARALRQERMYKTAMHLRKAAGWRIGRSGKRGGGQEARRGGTASGSTSSSSGS